MAPDKRNLSVSLTRQCTTFSFLVVNAVHEDLVGIGLIVLLGVAFFSSASSTLLLRAYKALGTMWQLAIDLVGIGFVAFIFAGLLSPLEALGWWAGWYGDRLDTTVAPGTLVEPIPTKTKIVRYAVYLDGIAQTNFQYLPEVDVFLNELAAVLPDDILIIKGLMPYSVINRPLTQGRMLSFLWRLADRLQASKSGGIIGALLLVAILLRNLTVVAVSADGRYGPIYNQGTAQVIYNSLLGHGYEPGSKIPITLIGYSGGGQIAMGAVTYLKQALAAPIDVISIAGVISGNNNVLKLEHLHHLVGDQDLVERAGPIFFPKRWQLFFLSYWNRAKRRGKISMTSLGPVGHNGAGGPLDPNKFLPDDRSYLQQTVDLVAGILQGKSPLAQTTSRNKTSNYELYQQAAFNQPSYYPLDRSVDPQLYRPVACWMGRLILPAFEQRRFVKGVLFEVHHTDPAHQHLVGQIVNLRWSDDPKVQAYVRTVTKDLHFSDEARYSLRQGIIHPNRLDRWQQVDPLESLAGARPHDDVIVMLRDRVEVRTNAGDDRPTIIIWREPVQITGRFYGLVKFLSPLENSDRFRVVHFNRTSGCFDGVEEIVCLPQVMADREGIFPSTSRDIEKSPLNSSGWYIYGAKDSAGMFVVQSLAPRALLRLQPDRVVFGKNAALNYIQKETWRNAVAQKSKTSSVLLFPQEGKNEQAIAQWQEGDRALLVHVYGGIGGSQREKAAQTPIFFGHFAYGVAQVVREPLADELQFDIKYCQVYTHNTDGLIAGTLAWNRYMGDRSFGWLGTRPVADILIKLDAFTKEYEFQEMKRSALDISIEQLEVMMARYRIGDGTGGTYVGPAHSCSQDSNQALYAALKKISIAVTFDSEMQDWLAQNPEQAQRFDRLMKLGKYIRRKLLPFGTARADWHNNENTLGISPEEDALSGLLIGLGSWRTMLPRLASETVTKLFIEQGASVWVLRTNQVGGYDSNIAPIAPTPIGW
ncbi:CAAX protease [Chroococcidiopsis cubana CCALA 043]|nr:CAAX protease [Chroococcidiopsis cubana CCALA 043]